MAKVTITMEDSRFDGMPKKQAESLARQFLDQGVLTPSDLTVSDVRVTVEHGPSSLKALRALEMA